MSKAGAPSSRAKHEHQPDDPSEFGIDFMMLADGAHAVGGKVYILGGNWDTLTVPKLPGRPTAQFSIALGFNIPYNLTNRKFNGVLQILDADGNTLGDTLNMQLEAGRPPGIRPGTPQKVSVALNAQPEFPRAGRYAVRFTVDGHNSKSAAFEVIEAAPNAIPEIPAA